MCIILALCLECRVDWKKYGMLNSMVPQFNENDIMHTKMFYYARIMHVASIMLKIMPALGGPYLGLFFL